MERSSDEVNRAIAAAANDLGFGTLTRKQTIVLQAFLSGIDVFFSLPTGLVVGNLCVTGSFLEC